MLITSEYLAIQKKLHEVKPNYGKSGKLYVDMLKPLLNKFQTRDVLDYGCGKRTLEEGLGFPIQNYDPAIPGLDAEPRPADMLVCTDVMEHIEPECLEDVLDHMESLTKGHAFIVVSMVPALKHFEDGRNLHLIVENERYWIPKLMQRWDMRLFQFMETEMLFIGAKRAAPSH